MTPAEAWARLEEGNRRFVAGEPRHPNQDAATRQSLQHAQVPFATLFGCSDSRVAAELIFDVGLGDMFVVRTAGQVTDSATLGSLEYGATVLGTPLLVVLGHDRCGAITAAAEAYETGESPPGFIADVVARLTPAVSQARRRGITEVNGIVEQNVRQAVHQLPERSTAIRQAVNAGRLVIAGVTYHLDVGRANLVASMGDLGAPATDAAKEIR
ncbi:carbonic anhydrase [Sediminivirga luteola]|uniref:carbonic anhydrase n=1 Tax=Sediminivirga luteola TaxID=1774748 RepID=A0A8J2XKH5_9MICO|nr:carbonic anhydrase [Sediminivirga luteola]MCI2265645.1 carbonic anhydrase [Sediminivirga luteola]GGA28264.1 carbonic anhydrase [Sediminivirga luteola]